MKLKFSHNGKNTFQITTSKSPKEINTSSFADLYDSLLYKRKSPPHPWKQKWEFEGNIEASDWVTVWKNVHHPSVSQKVLGSAWELLHRNYMCAYIANMIFQGTGICKEYRIQEYRIQI